MGWFGPPDCPKCGRQTSLGTTWAGVYYYCPRCTRKARTEREEKERLQQEVSDLSERLKKLEKLSGNS